VIEYDHAIPAFSVNCGNVYDLGSVCIYRWLSIIYNSNNAFQVLKC